jgi:hypothetical protein
VVGVQHSVDVGDLGAEHRLEGGGCGVEQGHLPAELPGAGGHLGADPAPADHRHAGGPRQSGPEAVGVAQVPEVDDAVEGGSGDPQPSRRGPGGEQQPVVPETLPGAEHDRAAAGVDPCHRARRA